MVNYVNVSGAQARAESACGKRSAPKYAISLKAKLTQSKWENPAPHRIPIL